MGSLTPTAAPTRALDLVRAARRAAVHPRPQPTRSRYEWTPASYLAAVHSAESGTFRGLGTFVRWLLTDGKIKSALAQRVDVMLAKDPQFDPPVDIPEDWYETLTPDAHKLALKIAILAGFCWVRFVPKLDAPSLQFEIEVWYPEHFDYAIHEGQWYVRTYDNYKPIFDGVDGWRLFTPEGKHEPWMQGHWLVVGVPALLKHYALDDRARNSEVGALLVGTLADADDEARQLYRDDLSNLAKETRVVLPNGGGLTMLDRTAPGQASVQKESIDWADNEITLSFLGQIVTTEGAAGFSSGQPQLVVLNAILKSQEKSYSAFVSVKLLSTWLELLHSEVLDSWQLTHPEFNRVVYQRWPVEIDADADTESAKFDKALQGFLAAIKAIREAGLIVTQQKVDELAKQYSVPSFDLPATATAKLTLAPTDIAKFTLVREGRGSQGLLPLGDARDELTIAQMGELPTDAPIPADPAAGAAPPAAAPLPGAAPVAGLETQSATDDDADVLALCAMMNGPVGPNGQPLPPVPTCEHGRRNDCTRCGIVRTRAVSHVLDEAGNPMEDERGEPVVKWQIAWKPLPKAPVLQ